VFRIAAVKSKNFLPIFGTWRRLESKTGNIAGLTTQQTHDILRKGKYGSGWNDDYPQTRKTAAAKATGTVMHGRNAESRFLASNDASVWPEPLRGISEKPLGDGASGLSTARMRDISFKAEILMEKGNIGVSKGRC